MHHRFPSLGFGLGLRTKHYPHIFEHRPKVDWFEIISENFMDTDGRPKRNLERVMADYPIVMHGVSLSIGTVDPLNSEYLTKLKALADWVNPAWISDHLCWTGVAHRNTHDLLPVPYTEEALKHIVERIKAVQDFLGRPIALENPSTYLEFKASHIPEAEFISRMAQDSGCALLLDVNNVYVSCYNHRLDPKTYLDALPLDHVVQIHLSGHTNKGTHIIDTHDDHVIDEVWALYQYVIAKAGRIPNTMIEWDDRIPEFPVLQAELDKARAVAQRVELPILPRLAQDKEIQPLPAQDTPALANLQQQLQENIISGNGAAAADDWILPKNNFAPQEQLGVYINAYRYRLRDVVAEDYPVLAKYLGDENFDQLVAAFVENTQSRHFNIGRYAKAFPDFVTRHLPDDTFAHDLARLETSITQLMDAPETPVLQQTDLDGMTPDLFVNAQLSPRAALELMTFAYPVNEYYRAAMNDEQPQRPAAAASYVAVFRHEDTMWRMELDAGEFTLLALLFDGHNIASALSHAPDTSAENLTDWFSRWMRNGLLAYPPNSTAQNLKESLRA